MSRRGTTRRGATPSDLSPAERSARLHDRALRLLAVRLRTRRELEIRLLRAGFDRTDISAELDRLQAVGLLDDERFAEEFAQHQATVRRAGTRTIRQALLAKGVPSWVAEGAVEGLVDDEEDRAVDLARRRAARLQGVEPAVALRRLVSLLARRGYGGELARRAARRALGAEEPGPEL